MNEKQDGGFDLSYFLKFECKLYRKCNHCPAQDGCKAINYQPKE